MSVVQAEVPPLHGWEPECPQTGLQGPDNSLVQYKIQMLKYMYTLTVETLTYLIAWHGLNLLLNACAAP